MKPRLNLIKCLHVLCIIGEAAAAVGVAAFLAVAPLLESAVRDGRAQVGIYAGHGSLSWSFKVRLANGHHVSVGFGSIDSGVRVSSGGDLPAVDYGRMSFGPVGLGPEPAAASSERRASRESPVAVNPTEGTATFLDPETAARAVAIARWPLIVGVLGAGGAGLAVIDLLRRMLRSACRAEVFTGANIRRVQAVGYLLIASSIVKFAAGVWLGGLISVFLLRHAGAGWASVLTSTQGDVSLLPGLLIVALAEVFRQGLALKEEGQLTI